MDLGLSGKRALVTGSSSGIGAAVADVLAAEGADVVVHGRDRDKLEAVAERVRGRGRRVDLALGDLSSDAGADEVVRAAAEGGPVDILVNNAGGTDLVPWFDAEPDLWAAAYQVNVVSAVRMIRAFVPAMRERGWGRVVQVGGGLATQPIAMQPQYSAALAARHNLAVSLARELKGTGVTSNVVSPGPIMVEYMRDWLARVGPERGWGTELPEIERRAAAEWVANDVGRYGTPEEVAAAVGYLASRQADYVTGSVLRVDGGFVAAVS
ncbi:SDR family NAD(P)-dependent oxidoreductase [Saccharothrix sp. 6-C]|uniref:SDR family NAD(P)-dependent oxidoreductase n=1 Tax=Saccharothrix sp. 6-C TaxID=2781735 RepID=UPI0019179E92|nr:SDR family NAD(P)-dependent oxidoreductase [Saccharothrix sp. 6-C]QQQ79288.1 SDR family NAD(P)-dependent oxidoreductase [Saccharothrix sp. 6-C]